MLRQKGLRKRPILMSNDLQRYRETKTETFRDFARFLELRHSGLKEMWRVYSEVQKNGNLQIYNCGAGFKVQRYSDLQAQRQRFLGKRYEDLDKQVRYKNQETQEN